MRMDSRTILAVGLAAVFVMGYYGTSSVAFAQYLGNVGSAGETGQNTLEENLELAKRRLEAVYENPGSGSGTPYLDASGVLGASIIAGAVFGGIAAAFFVRARSGRYAAMGRG